jgi:murein DD-endopeptidase MepM/ murein hydrolase activator NlpD
LANNHAVVARTDWNAHAFTNFVGNTNTMNLNKAVFSFWIFLLLLSAGCMQQEDLMPSQQPSPVGQGTPEPSATSIAPTEDAIDRLLSDLEATPVRFVYPTPNVNIGSEWRPPAYEVPLALRPEDHFYFRRPTPSDQVTWPHPQYRYGSTYFGDLSIHTGVDIGADRGSPVLAAGSGTVIWTGAGLYRGIDDPSDPYGLAIAIRHDFGHQGEPLYTIYAHLSEILVWLGQRVESGEQIGKVGETGQTSGPHLHFEVRLGRNDFFGSRNPELWVVPPEGWSVLAGKITTTGGLPLADQLIQITNLETENRWNVWTYLQEVANPDEEYDENFVISDLPAGAYEIRVDYWGVKFFTQLYLYPGRTNILNFHGWDGFELESEIEEAELFNPPI